MLGNTCETGGTNDKSGSHKWLGKKDNWQLNGKATDM